MPYQIFISHSQQDMALVRWIQRNLGQIGIETLVAEDWLRLGSTLSDKVRQMIERCDCVMVILTRRSQVSSYVHQEVGYALGLGKPVIPLVERGVPNNVLAMLGGLEYFPFDLAVPSNTPWEKLFHYLSDLARAKQTGSWLFGLGVAVSILLLLHSTQKTDTQPEAIQSRDAAGGS